MSERSILSGQSVAETVENAIQYLEENGWIQGELWSNQTMGLPEDNTPACIVGGLLITTNTYNKYATRHFHLQGCYYCAARDEISVDIPRMFANIEEFNDYEYNTFETIRDQLMITAKRLRNEGR